MAKLSVKHVLTLCDWLRNDPEWCAKNTAETVAQAFFNDSKVWVTPNQFHFYARAAGVKLALKRGGGPAPRTPDDAETPTVGGLNATLDELEKRYESKLAAMVQVIDKRCAERTADIQAATERLDRRIESVLEQVGSTPGATMRQRVEKIEAAYKNMLTTDERFAGILKRLDAISTQAFQALSTANGADTATRFLQTRIAALETKADKKGGV